MLYYTLFYSTTLRYYPILYYTIPYYTLLYLPLLHSTLLHSTPLYSTLLHSTPLYSTLLYSYLLYPTHVYSTNSTVFYDTVSSILPYSTIVDHDHNYIPYYTMLCNLLRNPTKFCNMILCYIAILYYAKILPPTSKHRALPVNAAQRCEDLPSCGAQCGAHQLSVGA